MSQIQLIKEFLAQNGIAVVGVSRKGDLPANLIFKKFKNSGYRAWQVNPNADEIEGDPCYHSIKSIPEKVTGVLLAGTPEVSESTSQEIIDLSINYVWMHRGIGKGSYSEKAEQILKSNQINVITQGCPMMFVKPVDSFHRIFRFFKRF